MQLGARWQAGQPPHRGVPAELHGIIAELESAHPGAQSWTLTWLEGRPRCALQCEPGCAGCAVQPEPVAVLADAPAAGDSDADDDDWLS